MLIKYEYQCGDIYEGSIDINTGLFHGNGILRYKNGDVYEGEFKYGKRHGKGIYTYKYPNALSFPFLKIYIGYFYEDKMHGYATITLIDDTKITCKYINNNFVLDNTYPIGEFTFGIFNNYKLKNNGLTYKIYYNNNLFEQSSNKSREMQSISQDLLFEGNILDSETNKNIINLNPDFLLDFSKIKI